MKNGENRENYIIRNNGLKTGHFRKSAYLIKKWVLYILLMKLALNTSEC